jgi:UDPglucose 6-dehydrogenase
LPTFLKRVDTWAKAINGADVVAVLTEWPEFALITPDDFAQRMHGREIVDGRYVLDRTKFSTFGINVRALGQVNT